MPKYLSRKHRLSDEEALDLGFLPAEGVQLLRIVVPGSAGLRLDVAVGPEGTFVRNFEAPEGYLKANSSRMRIFLQRTVRECKTLRMDAKTADRLGAMQIVPLCSDIVLSQTPDEVVLTYLDPQENPEPSPGLEDLGLSPAQ